MPRKVQRARFSGKRLAVEIVGGAAAGTLLSLGAYKATCGDGSDCLGPALLALGTNLVATPLAVYGIGSAMGGEGTLGKTYLIGLGGGGFGLIQPPQLGLALMLTFLPVTSALGYEISSNAWAAEHEVKLNVTAAPSMTGKATGGIASVSLRF